MTSCIKRSTGIILTLLICVIFFVLPTQQAHASELVPEWTQNHGGNENDVFRDSAVSEDGEYIVMVGDTRSSIYGTIQGYSDALVVCVDKEGNLIWARNFGGSGSSVFESVEVVGNYIYAAGSAEGASTNVSPGWGHEGPASVSDAIVVKLNLLDGTVEWANNYGGNGNDYFNAVTANEDTVYATGYTTAVSTNIAGANWGFEGGNDMILVRINPSTGEALWGSNYGGSTYDRAYGVVVEGDYVYVAGDSDAASTNIPSGNWGNEGGAYRHDGIIVKVEQNTGGALWGKNYGGEAEDSFRAIAAEQNALYITGDSLGASTNVSPSWSNEGSGDGIVLKINPSGGEVLWSNNYGEDQNETLFGITASNDAVYTVGTSMSSSTNFTPSWGNEGTFDAVALKIDSQDGSVLGANNYGGADWDLFYSVDQTADGLVYAAGYSYEESTNLSPHDWGNAGFADGILVKFASNNPPVDPTDPTNPTDNGNGLAKTADGTAPLGSAAIIILVVALVLFTSAQLGRPSKIKKQN